MTQVTGHTSAGGSTGHGAEMQRCIEACVSCHAVCTGTVQHCLQKGGQHAQPDHIRLLTDCAQICQTSADFMLRGSPLHSHTCGVCAVVCAECASDCEKMGEDQMMKQCADSCRRCAEECKRMSGHLH